jgi:hypothetical protein
LRQLTDYLKRVRDFIPNYASRNELGSRNGSGVVEKINKVLVVKRQKRDGMSWGHDGSIGLAILTCVVKNGDLDNWTKNRVIQFMPNPELAMAA